MRFVVLMPSAEILTFPVTNAKSMPHLELILCSGARRPNPGCQIFDAWNAQCLEDIRNTTQYEDHPDLAQAPHAPQPLEWTEPPPPPGRPPSVGTEAAR